MKNFIENPLAFASRMVTFYYEATGTNMGTGGTCT